MDIDKCGNQNADEKLERRRRQNRYAEAKHRYSLPDDVRKAAQRARQFLHRRNLTSGTLHTDSQLTLVDGLIQSLPSGRTNREESFHAELLDTRKLFLRGNEVEARDRAVALKNVVLAERTGISDSIALYCDQIVSDIGEEGRRIEIIRALTAKHDEVTQGFARQGNKLGLASSLVSTGNLYHDNVDVDLTYCRMAFRMVFQPDRMS